MATVTAVTSGKGGVGKTHLAVNLGVALAARGERVCLFDADTGLANANILLGASPRFTVEHVLSGERSLSEVLQPTPWDLTILPGASGVARCADLGPTARAQLVAALQGLEERFDHLVVDTAAGVGAGVLDFVEAARFKVVVITPEPTSLTDAFSLLKLARGRGTRGPFHLVVNRAADYAASRRVYARFRDAVRKYLKMEVGYLGYVAPDPAVEEAVRRQVPVLAHAPASPAGRCLDTLAEIVHWQFPRQDGAAGFSAYWRERAREAPADEPAAAANDPAPEAVTVERAVERLVSYLTGDATPPARAARALAPVLEAYERRFPGRSDSPTGDLFAHLHRRGYPESELRELIFTLEGIYEKTQGRPLRDPESLAALLLSERRGADGVRWLRRVLDTLEQGRM